LPPSAPPRNLGRRLLSSRTARALAGPHEIDHYLELLHPRATVQAVRGEVSGVRHLTPGSVTLKLRPTSTWRGFRAGQHVQAAVEVDGVRHSRSYSPASSEYVEDQFELTVTAHPEGTVSRHLHARARPGMMIGLSQAEGDFLLRQPRPERLLLISGGSGITPVMSMLRTLCHERHDGEVVFLHYARGAREAIYAREVADLAREHANVRVMRAYTRSGASAGELEGHFSREHLEAAVGDHANVEAYVCGPSALVDSVTAVWAEDGLSERLHVERFTLPTASAPHDDEGGRVLFSLSGIRLESDGRPLLEQAERAGLSPAYGCRMGICRTCTCRKVGGSVRDLRSGEISSPADEEIQPCVSVPVGEVTVDL
jgi:stearoyl-CoA 9-desaturase NADPH oxidoreductase